MTTQVITTRFPYKDAEDLKHYAELKQVPLAELVRLCCKSYVELEQQKLQLEQLKNEITQATFTMLTTVTDMSNEERQNAARLINSELDGVMVE
ncbi:hypothetical protein [Paraglaciecola hydrolytica]|uniref:CopG family transcriptional regulator n=1 Tax=Paraglaciecola hydrolytica TaxID=1799789 RepID=A0A148KKD7_9ALTE|nr:hypothetical protein [Paraglaciecola hydrolytica]KXI26782.1 hypothetical protein AX660_03160 [Paraglaciecola hydrolytica]